LPHSAAGCAADCVRCGEWGCSALAVTAVALSWLQQLLPKGDEGGARAALCAALAPRVVAALKREAETRAPPGASAPALLAAAASSTAAQLRASNLDPLLCGGSGGEVLLNALAAGHAARQQAELGAALGAARAAAARDLATSELPRRAPQPQDCPLPVGALEVLAALDAAPPARHRAVSSAALCYCTCAAPVAGSAPAAAMLFRNASHALARGLAAQGAAQLGAAAALCSAGDVSLAEAMREQEDEALGALQGAGGFRDAARKGATVAGALRGALHVCVRWAALAAELLPQCDAVRATAVLLETTCATVVLALLKLPDVGADDCSALAALITSALREAEGRGADASAAWAPATACAHSWGRLRTLSGLLEAPLRSLAEPRRWADFSTAELAGLVRSLFEDSIVRREVLASLGEA
jgi:hypothetical protein